MEYEICPNCRQKSLGEKHGTYVLPFAADRVAGGKTVAVKQASWEECAACGHKVLPCDLVESLLVEAEGRKPTDLLAAN